MGQVSGFLVVEMNSGQMVEDVRLAIDGKVPVEFFGRMGGIIPTPEEVCAKITEFESKLHTQFEATETVEESII